MSTNSELISAITRAQLPADRPHLYTADSQSSGRGQHGRVWLSPLGNVYLSLYVPMRAQQNHPNQHHLHRLTGALSLCAGLELWQMDSIQQLNATLIKQKLPPIAIKWANDLGIYQPSAGQFYKLAGILIEPVLKNSAMLGVVIGVGVNVAHAPIVKGGLYPSTSLNALAQHSNSHPHTASALFTPIACALLQAVDCHNRFTLPFGAQAVLSNDFIAAFNAAHALQGRAVAIFYQGNSKIPDCLGICQGINSAGALQLQTSDGMSSVFAGQAKILPALAGGLCCFGKNTLD